MDLMRMYVLRGGAIVHPGANYVIRADGRRIRVTEINKEELAEKVETDGPSRDRLMDGDIVLFNRQPSLHKMSHHGAQGKSPSLQDIQA